MNCAIPLIFVMGLFAVTVTAVQWLHTEMVKLGSEMSERVSEIHQHLMSLHSDLDAIFDKLEKL